MGSDPERTFSGPEREYIKETYDVMLGTFKEYAEMIIQVGHWVLKRVALVPSKKHVPSEIYARTFEAAAKSYSSTSSSSYECGVNVQVLCDKGSNTPPGLISLPPSAIAAKPVRLRNSFCCCLPAFVPHGLGQQLH